MGYFDNIGMELMGRSPYIIAWVVALVFAMLMVRRGGGRAERLLLAGCSLMLFVQLISPFLNAIVPWANRQGLSLITIAFIISIAIGVVSLAGIVCLVYAFWLRFSKNNQDTAV
ncbi:MAG: hypothetical protein V1691_02125 [Chloroflexota bacterium]